jgi:CBS domain containing-hemolysin-like protein
VDTVSGYVTHELGRFPEPGDKVALGPYTVRAISVHRRQVRQASVFKTAETESAKGDQEGHES